MGTWRGQGVPAAQGVVVTLPHPRQVPTRLEPRQWAQVGRWRAPASSPDGSSRASHDDVPWICRLLPGCLHPLPHHALPADLSSREEALHVWIRRSINCTIKAAGRLLSVVIEGFPPQPGAPPVRSLLPGRVGGREASGRSPGHCYPCTFPSPAGRLYPPHS